MKESEKFTLIEGIFSQEESKEILMNIYSSKINFHQLKNFNSHERFGKDDEVALKRISELKKETQRLMDIFSNEEIKNKKLSISSEINISIVEE